MAADYAKKTNAELVELLKARSLPHNGKKAEMVARLEEDDAKGAKPDGASTTAAKTDNAEDVIDWDDEAPAVTEPSTETGAAAIAAGGQGSVSNPAAVPNQELGEDPAKTDDLKVEAKGIIPNGAGEGAQAEGEAAQAEEKPAPNFAKGLPVSEFEEELKKRKARAEKFGNTEDAKASIAEAEKQLERAKRFGTGGAEGNPNVGVRGLDEALPMERGRKRGYGDNQGGRGGKRRNFGGRNNFRRRGRIQKPSGGGNGNNTQSNLGEKDAAALEARKKRFGTAT